MPEPGTTPGSTVIGFTDRELNQRWDEITAALTNAAIAPDPLTLAALMLGTSKAMAERGIRPVEERKRQIGFAPTKE